MAFDSYLGLASTCVQLNAVELGKRKRSSTDQQAGKSTMHTKVGIFVNFVGSSRKIKDASRSTAVSLQLSLTTHAFTEPLMILGTLFHPHFCVPLS